MPGPTPNISNVISQSVDYFRSCDDVNEAWGYSRDSSGIQRTHHEEHNGEEEEEEEGGEEEEEEGKVSLRYEQKFVRSRKNKFTMNVCDEKEEDDYGDDSPVLTMECLKESHEDFEEGIEAVEDYGEGRTEENMPVVEARLCIANALTRQKIGSVQRGRTLSYADKADSQEAPTRRTKPLSHPRESLEVGGNSLNQEYKEEDLIPPTAPPKNRNKNKVGRNPSYSSAVRNVDIIKNAQIGNPESVDLMDSGASSKESSPELDYMYHSTSTVHEMLVSTEHPPRLTPEREKMSPYLGSSPSLREKTPPFPSISPRHKTPPSREKTPPFLSPSSKEKSPPYLSPTRREKTPPRIKSSEKRKTPPRLTLPNSGKTMSSNDLAMGANSMTRSASFSECTMLPDPPANDIDSIVETYGRRGSISQPSTPVTKRAQPDFKLAKEFNQSKSTNIPVRGSAITRSFKRLFSAPAKTITVTTPPSDDEAGLDLPDLDQGTQTPSVSPDSRSTSRLRKLSTTLTRKLSTRTSSSKMSASASFPGGSNNTGLPNGETSPFPDPNTLIAYEELVKLFCCSGCQILMTPPFYQCRKGHMVCNGCRFNLKQSCPVCKQRFLEITNTMMEQVYSFIKFPCKYSSSGCPEFHPPKSRLDHEHFCAYRPLHCHHANKGCKQILILRDMHQHVEECEFKHKQIDK